MNMPYEMFLTIQLMQLTCRKDHIQSPTRKGWDLFRRTSDDNSIFTPINIHEDEPEAPKARDTMMEERALEEYKRAVYPPREMKTILGTRGSPIWRK